MSRRIDDVPVALLAGGLATRLQPVSKTVPKAMVDVAGRPFIDHQLELLHQNGVRQVVMCLGHLGHQVQEHLGDGRAFGIRIDYSFDGSRLLGTGGAIAAAAEKLGDVFWVIYADTYLNIDYRAVLDYFNQQTPLGLMTVLRNNNRWDRSNVVFRDGVLLKYSKRDTDPAMEYIDYGAAILSRRVFDGFPAERPCDLGDVYSSLVRGRNMIGFEVHERFYEIGTPAALEETRTYLMTQRSA